MNIIIPIIVGSVIGYLTNWLAIKMLFRPLREKRLLGVRLPFTPGLIPKERQRMAKSIGEAVGEHLLTPEKIQEVFLSHESKEKMRAFIDLKIHSLKKNDNTIKTTIKNIDSDNYHRLLNVINEKIFNYIIVGIRDKDLKEDLLKFVEEDIYHKYKDKARDKLFYLSKDMLDAIKDSPKLKSFFIEKFERELRDKDKLLKEVISDEIIEKIEKSIDDNKLEIVGQLRELFYRPHVQTNIKLSIENLVEENVSKMITMFIDSATISEKVFQAISKYVDSSQAEDMTSFILKDSLDNIANMRLASVVEYIISITDKEDISAIYDKLVDYIFKEENKDLLSNIIIKNIKEKDREIKDSLLGYLEYSMDKLIESNNFHLMVGEFIDKNINRIMNKSISNTLKNLDEEKIRKLMDISDKLFNSLLKEELYNIINLFDISEIVEDQINSFEIEYTEKLILEIADRELKAITRLGALIGAVMGLLMPILQRI